VTERDRERQRERESERERRTNLEVGALCVSNEVANGFDLCRDESNEGGEALELGMERVHVLWVGCKEGHRTGLLDDRIDDSLLGEFLLEDLVCRFEVAAVTVLQRENDSANEGEDLVDDPERERRVCLRCHWLLRFRQSGDECGATPLGGSSLLLLGLLHLLLLSLLALFLLFCSALP